MFIVCISCLTSDQDHVDREIFGVGEKIKTKSHSFISQMLTVHLLRAGVWPSAGNTAVNKADRIPGVVELMF